MRTTSQKTNRLCKRLIAAAALPAVVAMFGTVSAFAGAIFTTDLNCEKVNGNIYNTKQDVYLNGGPDGTGSALDPLTTYCVRVSAPGGIANLNATECRVTTDASGHFSCFNLFDCTGFGDTDNPGGEYTVEVCPLKANGDCDFRTSTQCKSDNFKVRASVHACVPDPCVSISCPENIEIPCTKVNGTCLAVDFIDPIVMPATASVTCVPPSGACCAAGETTQVTCTANDGLGHTANCSFTVTVGACPQCTLICPDLVTQCNDAGKCSAVVNYLAPTCDVPVTCLPASGSTFNVGTTTVTCTATDGGDFTDSCHFDVTVNDCEAPQITCPGDITAKLSDTGTECCRVVNYTTPAATDNCPGTIAVTCSPASGTSFCIGSTTVTCTTGNDAAGNGPASCTFQVTVVRCPLTIGYWKTHPNNWPVASLTLGTRSYTKTQLLAALNQSVGNGTTANALLILADQLIAAKLNKINITKCNPTAAGFCDSAIATADGLIGSTVIVSSTTPYTFGYVKASTTQGKAMTAAGSNLNTCNNSCTATQ